MNSRAIGVALLLSILPMAGCGTIVNLVDQHPGEGGTSPFGGVRQDMIWREKAANGESCLGTCFKREPAQHRLPAHMAVWTADLPLSFVADVVTWPYTASYAFINQPVPVPPVTEAPTLPPQQASAQPKPKTSPEEALPEPRELSPPTKDGPPQPKELPRPLQEPDPESGQLE